MRTQTIAALGVALGAIVLAGSGFKARTFDTLKPGDKAPAFSAAGTDGKTYTLASLTKEGPVFLYFIKEGCPVNHKAAPFITKMFGQYGGKPNVIGVYNGDVDAAKSWQKRYGAKYTLLADPNLSIIHGYGAPYSPFMIVVGKDQKVSKVLEGLSPKELTSANTLIAKSLHKDAVAMSFEGAPSGGG